MRPSSATITLLLGVLCAGLPALPARADMGPCRLDPNEEATCGHGGRATGRPRVRVKATRPKKEGEATGCPPGVSGAARGGGSCAKRPQAGAGGENKRKKGVQAAE